MEEFEYNSPNGDYIEVSGEQKNEKPRRYKRKRKKRIPLIRIGGALIIMFLLVYFSMLVYSSNFTVLKTEKATAFEVNDYIEVDAYALRNEEYILNTNKGIIAYVVDDGEKVNASGSVAKLFATEADVQSWQEYNSINDELELLKQLTSVSGNMFVDLDTVDSQIRNGITSYKNELQGNRFSLVRDSKLELLQLFNERVVVTGGSSNFQGRIGELEQQLESMSVSKSIGEVKSKKSGVFVSGMDGYESSLDFDNVDKLMADDVKNMLKKNPPNNAVGKIITTLNWYLLCPITAEQAITVSSGDEIVEISIPKVISGSVPGTVVAVNQGSKTQEGLMILKCDYMDSKLGGIRQEDITIKTKSYSGIRVSRKAIHEDFISVQDYDEEGNAVGQPHDEKVQGVYVLFGRRLVFKQVNIIYSEKDFVICSTDLTDPALLNGQTVSLYDEVVVQGKDLYNGKLIK